jgi:hypothetical protein
MQDFIIGFFLCRDVERTVARSRGDAVTRARAEKTRQNL